MDKQTSKLLSQFLIFIAKEGYANPDTKKKRQSDGSDTILLKKENFTFNDNYFTSQDGRRFHGREVVFKDNKPYWFVAYSGYVNREEDPNGVYIFLKEAMLQPMHQFPVRGPERFQKNDLLYEFTDIIGDLSEFSANEYIKRNNKQIYNCYFIGGIID